MTKQWNFDLFIDGKWDKGEAGGEPIEVINPATEEVIGSVPEASKKDTLRAIEAARRAFDEGPWPWMKPAERAGYVRRMGEILTAKGAELRDLMLAQTGSAGFILDFVQAGGSIGMWKSNADIAEHSFNWVEAKHPPRGPRGSG